MVFLLMNPVKMSIPITAASMGLPLCTIIMSSSPSVMLAWGYVGVVAPLRGVGHGYKEGFLGENLAVGAEGVGLGRNCTYSLTALLI